MFSLASPSLSKNMTFVAFADVEIDHPIFLLHLDHYISSKSQDLHQDITVLLKFQQLFSRLVFCLFGNGF